MEEQEWRKHARRHAPPRTNQTAHGAVSPRAGSAHSRLSNATIASANRSVPRKNEPRASGHQNGLGSAQVPSSRWKEMRQAVRIKATLDTDERHASDARIADLCDEDREKVAKLVRRIVEVSALHEQSESEFARQRALLESEVHELRDHAKRDAREIDALSDKLKDALDKLRGYQERVLVLEESNDLEVRHRLETDQTVDLLKLEVDKLRKLVKRQKLEMERQESERQRKHADEMEEMARQVRESHELLLRERRERLEEKQKELEDRIQRTTASTTESVAVTNTINKYDPPGAPPAVAERVTLPMDMSSLLNTSADLPDKIKEIMNEWKQRMEDALNTTAASIAEARAAPVAGRLVSTGIQTDSVISSEESRRMQRDAGSPRRSPRPQSRVSRADFDRMLVGEPDQRTCPPRLSSPRGNNPIERSTSPVSRSSRSPRRTTIHRHNTPSFAPTPSSHDRSVTRALLDEFATTSVLIDDDSFEDEVESTIALIDGLHSPPQADSTPVRGMQRAVPSRNVSLFDSSMLDVVDAMEGSGAGIMRARSPRSYYQEEESPTTRVERLMEGLRVREQKLARVSSRPSARSEEPSFLQDVELFNAVKDVYEADLQQGRREVHHTSNGGFPKYDDEYDDYNHADHASDPLSSSHSSHALSVQEAIEQDMQELLRQESFLPRR